MKSLVIYASHYGNTRKVAEAIADGLRAYGPVDVVAVEDAPTILPPDDDIIVVGGPTEGHGMTEPLVHFLERIPANGIRGVSAATFDTRLRWPRWLSGSAGAGVEQRLLALGARILAPTESFFVKGNATLGHEPQLDPGELQRARDWARALADTANARTTASAAR